MKFYIKTGSPAETMYKRIFRLTLDNCFTELAGLSPNIPSHVIYNGITTIAIFPDGKKIISRPNKGEKFDMETGLAMCIAKRVYGSRSAFLRAVEGANNQNKVDGAS